MSDLEFMNFMVFSVLMVVMLVVIPVLTGILVKENRILDILRERKEIRYWVDQDRMCWTTDVPSESGNPVYVGHRDVNGYFDEWPGWTENCDLVEIPPEKKS